MRRDVFQAIADPNRREILNVLAKKKMTVNQVARQFNISRPAVSRHVKILSECGLIATTMIGREKYCKVHVEKLNEVSDWVDHCRSMWEQKLDALDEYLNAGAASGKKKSGK